MRTVTVLGVAKKTAYNDIAGVDLYDIGRDMRTYSGHNPVVCHPPCRAWSRFYRHMAQPLPGEKELAIFCVETLRRCGGVLEHPAYSLLWDALDIPRPGERERGGLWCVRVDQYWFGDSRRKKTWLLFAGVDRRSLVIPYRLSPRTFADLWSANSGRKRSATPPAAAQWFVDIARESRVDCEVPIV